MQPIDYGQLLDTGNVARFLPAGAVIAEGAYDNLDGLQFRSERETGKLVHDMVRLSDRAFLIASDHSPGAAQLHHQIVNESDWLHIQFRVRGSGREKIADEIVETPEKACIVARYPEHALVERHSDQTGAWRVACLFLSPQGLTDLLDTPAARLPEHVAWMGADAHAPLQASAVSLTPAMVLAVNDVISCPFRGANRRAYMRAKSLELLASVIHSLDSAAPAARPITKLSSADIAKIAIARSIMIEDLERNFTLAELARKVGVNRTKLAMGFKEVYGTSVQAFWRDAKLMRARELLREDCSRVTDVALSLGYAELSSFTRAFSRKFGVLPRACKRNVL